MFCVGSVGLYSAGVIAGSEAPIDSWALWPVDAGGGGGGARGAVNSSSAAAALFAPPGRLDARGGGGASRLVLPSAGDAAVLERLLSRDSVLCASANRDGTEEVEAFRSCCGAVATVGVERSGVGVLVFRIAGVSESPRAGRSACFAGGYVAPGRSLCLGSSNGLTSELGDSTSLGD